MRSGTRIFGLTAVLLAAATSLGGCGRKNLPVSPRTVAGPVNAPGSTDSETPTSEAGFRQSNLAPFTNASRITASGNSSLSIRPAEVYNNPKAPRRRFLLDGLLN